jgi:hypothetical protein
MSPTCSKKDLAGKNLLPIDAAASISSSASGTASVRSLLGVLSLGDAAASPVSRVLRYVAATLKRPGGNRRERRRSRAGAGAAALAVTAFALVLAACGESSSSESNEAAGTYPVKVVTAEFPAKQRLGETSLMRIGIRNTGRRALPALTVNVSIAGKQGQNSSLPFGYRDPEPGLAQPDRPVWVLSHGYPKLDGSSSPGGAESASKKTFDFGPLKPGATTEAIWKLTAVKAGKFAVLYEVGAGLSGAGKAETAGGSEAGGSFTARVNNVPPNSEVTDSGAVVEIPSRRK